MYGRGGMFRGSSDVGPKGNGLARVGPENPGVVLQRKIFVGIRGSMTKHLSRTR